MVKLFLFQRTGGICYDGGAIGSVSGESNVEKNIPDDQWSSGEIG